jgi:hypothetical protein
MTDLDETLTQLRQRISRHREQPLGEQNTKAILIEPLLRGLGWDVEDFDEVHREYKPKPTDNPVDYALFILRTPRLFVEAKDLHGNLDDRRWANQIMGYAAVTGVEWVVLTDGDEYRIYNAHAPVPIEEKLFRLVKISDGHSHVGETLALLSKAQLRENLIESLWKSDFVDQQVKGALDSLFSPEPDPHFVRFVRNRLPKLTPSEVKESLSRLRISLDFPAVTPLPTQLRRERLGSSGSHPTDPSRGTESPSGKGTPWRAVTLQDVISSGLVQLPLPIEKTYYGQRLTGRITVAGKVSWGDKEYDSLSTAAGYARASIVGPKPGRKYPQTNGWVFWEFVDSDGQRKPLDVLRQRYHRQAGLVG